MSRDQAVRLEAIAQAAIAVTLDEPVGPAVDAQQLIADLSTVLEGVKTDPQGMLPMVERALAVVEPACAKAPPSVARTALDHQIETLKWRRDMPKMPDRIVAFVLRDRLSIARSNCNYWIAETRYKALYMTGDRCDCAARVAACFTFGRPTGPLELEDSSGVPFAAMDYQWRCKACGTRWLQEEGHDDSGSHSTWRLVPQ